MQKIMFNDKYGLTQAVLEGRKTMTRRVVPECRALDILRLWERNEGAVATGYEEKTQSFRFDYCPDKKRRFSIDHLNLIPRYKVGEVVAVAQSYKDVRHGGYPVDSRYDAFREADWGVCVNGALKVTAGENNKMFVRADLMPHRIRITNVRVERLQDISDEECLKEGISKSSAPGQYYVDGLQRPMHNDGVLRSFTSPRDAFATLIDKVSGNGTWESNPWVFVYEFELVK